MERKWYDEHKSQILNDCFEELTVDELMTYFSYTGEFFAVFEDLFSKIAKEENTKSPLFGNLESLRENVLEFYSFWSNFQTTKAFKDKWRILDQDRRTRRLMEKENSKERIVQKKKYNETIQKLVSFVYRRDSRIKQQVHVKKKIIIQKQETKEYIVPEWDTAELEFVENDLIPCPAGCDFYIGENLETEHHLNTIQHKKNAQKLKEEEEEEKEEKVAQFCEICNKKFETKLQMNAHLKSKVHLKSLKLQKKPIKDKEVKEKEEKVKEKKEKKIKKPICKVCNEVFESRNKLFEHIKLQKHLK